MRSRRSLYGINWNFSKAALSLDLCSVVDNRPDPSKCGCAISRSALPAVEYKREVSYVLLILFCKAKIDLFDENKYRTLTYYLTLELAPKVVVPRCSARATELGRCCRYHLFLGAGAEQLCAPSNPLILPRRVSGLSAMTAVTPACKAPPGPPVPPRPPVSSKKAAKRRLKRLEKRSQKENGATEMFYYTVSRPPFIVVEN